jgi:hypothetical protein
LIGLTITRNESWVIGYSLRAALGWCDHVVVLCHACEDNTAEIVEIVSRETSRVTVLYEDNPVFEEMDYRQRMLEAARLLGASHIAILDGDEVVTASLQSAIRYRISLLPSGGVLVTPIHNLWRSLDRYRNDDRKYGNGWVILAFGDEPHAEWRPAEDGYQFHQRLPRGRWLSPMRWPVERELGGLMHLQHASWPRVVAKHRWYKVTETLRWPHRDREVVRKLYGAALDEADIRVLPAPAGWWAHGLDRSLINLDAPSWHAAEVDRLIVEHGRQKFTGLDLLDDE